MFKTIVRTLIICCSLLLASCGMKGPLEYPKLSQATPAVTADTNFDYHFRT